jgi:hypothetical protein
MKRYKFGIDLKKLIIGVWVLLLTANGSSIPDNVTWIETDLSQNGPEGVSKYNLGL